MTTFELNKLNVDMSRFVPSQAEMKTLVDAFKERVRASTLNGELELLRSYRPRHRMR